MTDDRDDLLTKLSFFRDQQFAQWVVLAISLAAETQPEAMRNGLARVFDLKRVNEQHDEIMRRTLLARQDLESIKAELAELRETVRKAHAYVATPNGARR